MCFCGNRTDNAIKNHWNSSVKKKLDSYLASGLLTQLQTVPIAGNPNQPIASTSSRLQRSGDDSGPRGTEEEEASQCSQESANAGHFPYAGDMSIAVFENGEDYRPNEESNLCNPSQVSCSEPYYISLGDVSASLPDTACQEDYSAQMIEYTHEPRHITNGDNQLSSHALPNISSLGFEHESSQVQNGCIVPSESHDMVNVPFHSSEHMFIPDDECCRILFSEAMGDYNKGENMIDSNGCASLHSPSSGPSSSGARLLYTAEANQLLGSEDQQFISEAHDNLIYANGLNSSPCIDRNRIDSAAMQETPGIENDTSSLVPVNSFCHGSDTIQTSNPRDEEPNGHAEQEEAGALCYEPPRFPSLDIPFLSCDLVQSGGDMQQEFSPLGIRQFMMSSMNCLTPFKLWDSPSRDDSPDALLRSAAKTFTATPSILKKRSRDLLSPLSDKRIDKKLEVDMTSTLIKNFSRLDVMFVDNETQHLLSPASVEKLNSGTSVEDDKENHREAIKVEQVEEKNESANLDDKKSEEDTDKSNSEDMTEQRPLDIDSKTTNDVIVAATVSITILKSAVIQNVIITYLVI